MPDPVSPTSPTVKRLTQGLVAHLLAQVKSSERQDRDAIDDSNAFWFHAPPQKAARSNGPVVMQVAYPPPPEPPMPPAALRELLDTTDYSNASAPPPRLPAPADEDPADSATQDELTRDYERWLAAWTKWAEHERRMGEQRATYTHLERLQRQVQQRGDTEELVLGVGLVSSGIDGRWDIRRHVLIWGATIVGDPATDTLQVHVSLDERMKVEDQDFLTSRDGYRTNGSGSPWYDGDVQIRPFSPEVVNWLQRWKRRRWDRALPFTEDPWGPPSHEEPGAAQLTLAPALFLRRRNRKGLERVYDAIAGSLQEPSVPTPLGLAQLVAPIEPTQRRAWLTNTQHDRPVNSADPLFPLASNREQRRVLAKLSDDTTVVVQGPPGTGKTHTIANLICALLADGQRLLITSQKDQALRVLREKLPEEVRRLCVLMTGMQRTETDELDRSITALSELSSTVTADELGREITKLRDQRSDLTTALQQAIRDLRIVREQEYSQHPPFAHGYGGTLAQIVEQLNAGREQHTWIEPLPAGAPGDPPLSNDQARQLWQLLTLATPHRSTRVRQLIPGPDMVPPPADIATMVATITEAERTLGPDRTTTAWSLAALDDATLAGIQRHIEGAADALATCGLSDTINDWDGTDWRRTAAEALLARRSPAYWEALFNELRDVEPHVRALGTLNGVDIDLGTMPLTAVNLTRLTGQAKRLRKHLSRGGRLRRYWQTKAQLEATDLLQACTVDGAPPATVAELTALTTHLQAEAAVSAVLEAWAPAGVPTVYGPLRRRVAHLNDISHNASALRALTTARDAIEQLLRRHQIRFAIRSPDHWDLLVRVSHNRQTIAAARHATDVMTELTSTMQAWSRNPDVAPEVADIAAALASSDIDRYAATRTNLDHARNDKDLQQRCDALLSILTDAHPTLAQQITDNLDDPTWAQRLGDIEAAWAWGVAATYYQLVRQPNAEQIHELQIDDLELALNRITAELAGKQALRHCLERMTERQRQALQSYKTNMGSYGRGQGKSKDRYLKAAFDAMRDAQQAVPAWVMPLSAVTDTIPPQHNTFDVVIVDEASQASIDNLFLLWLAPRVIVVGDEKQCAPGANYRNNDSDAVQESLDRHLADMPMNLRNGFLPSSNLYELLASRFSDVVRLSEHFRCMPEIIGWSSEQFYDKRLIPLRQFGADRLDPLRVVYVDGAAEEGQKATLRNQVEANTIIDHVQKIIDDPMCRNKSIGIIALQSGRQTHTLEKLLNDRIDRADIRRRRIRVGQPPDFQGDERDIILLSMVVTKARRALTSRTEQRRYNVAASRARDQLWLFTSVPATSLNPTDLRHSLLSYMLHPPATLTIDPDLDDITPDTRTEPFTCLLQQRVFLELRRRGYAVVPHHPVDQRAIDLVIVGDNGRLAVECDTPTRPRQPEQVQQELHRERELRRAGWQFIRIRDSEYLYDRDAALEPMWQQLKQRGIEPRSLPAAPRQQPQWRPTTLSDDEDEL
ncbi:AAA domain-containing protein [Micromonospora violae]|uniref:AAA domain-containing protein n=1 Tax=Micromonospora violae TaxID=1278207 RepID=A0A4Q7UFR7_9ACTN|nr:AAA domain-containing protein [Micromonospora violae]RZT79674.1 AAA domain-containing protein [Micromonospora violae]